MSDIPFKQIPSNIRVPLFYAELDNSQANSATVQQRTLIIGQMSSSGTGTANVPTLSQGVGDAAAVGGLNSMLHLMTNAYRNSDSFGELWYGPLADPGGVAATGSIKFTAVPTAAGVLSLYIGGTLVQISVDPTFTTSSMATALAAAIGLTPLMPVTAAVDGSDSTKVDLTAVNVGTCGNDIDLRLNYGGAAAGQATPAGLTVTITAMSGGTLVPTLTTLLQNLASKAFDFIVCPYTDSVSLSALAAFMNDNTGRWAWSQQIYGHVFCALRGTYSALVTAGGNYNNQHQTILGFNDSPSMNWLWAADYAGACAVSLRNDPSLPLQTVALSTVLPPPTQSQFTLPQQNTLLYNGISTFSVIDGGGVELQNVITSYRVNTFNQPDDSYLEVETMFTLMYVIRFLRSRITTKYARFKLADDGTRFAPGAAIVTPSIIRADQIAAFQELEENGFVQDADAFAANLIVQRNSQNRNRLDVLWPGTLIDQLRVFAVLFQFRK